jgi:EAL domain-containing protein (putative c-di-GMP-specific phosphodiesterase class I)/PleD family two-component response regulator
MTQILVIEDNASARENLVQILELEGFDVVAAGDGVAGLALAQQQRPDLILCDIMMPRLDGYGVLAKLAQHEDTLAIPLIFLTAKSTPADIRQGMVQGASDYISKPFSPRDVLAAVTTQLQKQAAIAQHYHQTIQTLEQSLFDLTHRHPITQLPNEPALNAQLAQLQSQGVTQAAVVALTLRQVPLLEHVLGEALRDRLLRHLVDAIQAVVAAQPSAVAAAIQMFYVGRARFALLLTGAMSATDLQTLATTLVHHLGQPVTLGDQTLALTVHVGADSTTDPPSFTDLWANSKLALYEASQTLVDYCRYTPTLRATTLETLTLASHLHCAQDHQELDLHYQPQMDLASGRWIAVEALLRWRSPVLGDVSPDRFIPIAESTGLIHALSDWVLARAIAQLHPWHQAMDPGDPPLKISINLSPHQFQQPHLADTLRAQLDQAQIAPEHIILEITEGVLIQDMAAAIATLKTLRAIGFILAVDDFGTGYSSLSYLSQLPLDIVKIDREFIRHLDQRPSNQLIVESITTLAHRLDLTVVAEGAETPAEIEQVRQLGVDILQGYGVSPPLSAAVLLTQLSTRLPVQPRLLE